MAAPQFPVNTHRFDPYRNYKFLIYFGENPTPVAGVSKISALKKTTSAVDWREGGDPTHVRKLIGKTSYEAITLEAGLTHDKTFEEWADLVNNLDGDGAMSLQNFRKDIRIELTNLQGVAQIGYKVFRCWVSEYQAMPELDAGAEAVAIRMIKLENEGWQVDTDITEDAET